jgi:mannose-6-phosphate isomerase
MTNKLYPIKFKPVLKEKIWGGNNLSDFINKKFNPDIKIGESWEISGLEPDISIVSNGFLKGNTLQEIVEIYMGDLVGDLVFEKFGLDFPLLIKFIDATEMLSIQVHPDDEIAIQRHKSYGKTEMWYILKAAEGTQLINGFKSTTEKKAYLDALADGKIEHLLNYEIAHPGDVFFIPPGRVHAIGSGIVLAEIQQTSDVTYRIYDWGRTDNAGNPRELHTELALDVIDFSETRDAKVIYQIKKNETCDLVECQYFKTNLLEFDKIIEKDYIHIDSFIILICLQGNFHIDYGNEKKEKVEVGESILIPAILKNILLIPSGSVKILEVYLPEI